MKIQGWLVERFGVLRNHEVCNLPDGLTIFYGPNGAGKSTLFAFLRQMLFGRARPDADGRGPVLTHDSSAGRLYCAGPGGVYTIACTAGNRYVTRPDGEEGSEIDLEYLFGGADGRLVGSLLAFDAQDLRALPPLTRPGIRERIFPAGVGSRRNSIRRALSAIQARLSKIAQRAGSDLHGLLTTPVDLQAHIDHATRAAARYCQILQAQAQARVEVDLGTRTISDLRAEKAKCDALVDLWPVWQDITQARREFENIEAFDGFPADPEARLEQALAARQAAERTVEQLVDQERPPRREVAVTPDDSTVGISSAIEARTGAGVRQRERFQEFAGTPADLAPAQQERLPSNGEELIAWQRRLKDVGEAVKDRQRELDAAKQTVRNLERAKNEISTSLSPLEPPSAAVLDEEARLLQRVRATLDGLDRDQASTKQWQELIAERGGLLRTLETRVPQVPSAMLPRVAVFAAVLGIMAAVWRNAAGDMFGLTVLVFCSLVSAAGAAVQRSHRTRALNDGLSRRTRLSVLRGEVDRGCQSLLHHQERLAQRRFDISVDSARLGLSPMPSDRQLREREAELDAQRGRRREWDNAQAVLNETLAAVARSDELERQHAQALLTAQTHERHTIEEWHQWKVRAGLADNGSDLPGAGKAVSAGAELLQHCRRLRTQIAECERNAAEWNARARAALAKARESEGFHAVGGAAVDLVGRDRAEDVRPGRGKTAQPYEQHSPALDAARRRLGRCEDALAQLFAEAGASNEAAFRARMATYRRRLALEQTIRSCEVRSRERLSQEQAADAILLELPEGQVEEWRRRATRAAAGLTALEASRDEAVRQLRRLDADACAASAEAADLPVLEVERSGLATEAIETVRAWRTLAIAASLLAEAQREVERESQPAVLRRASQVLSAVTFSRYERLLQSDDQHELLVLDSTSGRKSVEQLSRATVEQLYFSLRLGLAEEHAQSATSLPLVIDDVLDGFDPKRSAAMAHQIVEVGRRRQTLVFTRRPETCDLLRSLDPAANVITMSEL